MSTRVKKTVPQLLTKAAAEAEMKRFADAASEQKRLEAELELEVSALRAKYGQQMQRHQEVQKEALAGLERYAQTNAEALFKKSKSHELQHGIIGFRQGNPQVVKPRGCTWTYLLEQFKARQLPFVRTKEEPDKQAIVAARNDPQTMTELGKLGISVVQQETFFCEAKTEAFSPPEPPKSTQKKHA